MKNLTLVNTSKMTSMEVAEVTRKRHTDILRDIRDEVKKLESAGIETERKFASRERQGLTGNIPYYELTKEGILQLAARYDAVVRAKLIDMAMSIQESKPKTQIQVLQEAIAVLADQERQLNEIKTIAIEAKSGLDQAKETINNIKNTVGELPKDNWRDWANNSFIEINKATEVSYRDLKSESYKLLEERAGADLSQRVRNARKRLEEVGATKTAIENYRKIDAIENDKRLKEIYTGVIKELVIKYLA